jgi:tRNA dimethylallyltransferase
METVAAPLIAVVGPTASGKTELGLRLAEAARGEIVSCDSRQVYRGLDIGSAKPTPAERARAPHHLIDVVDPDEDFSAVDYVRLARQALAGIVLRGNVPVVVGGTGLYLRALLEGLFPGPARDEDLRRRFAAWADRFGEARVHRLLRRVDPQSAERIRSGDRLRLMRALEVFFLTGRSLSEHHTGSHDALRGFTVLQIGLNPGREALRRSVERRTHEMMTRGLVDEVRGLLDRGYGRQLRSLQAIGYRQAIRVAEGGLDPGEAEREIATATMQYAKRQMTWFRHHGPVRWFVEGEEARGFALRWLMERGVRLPDGVAGSCVSSAGTTI